MVVGVIPVGASHMVGRYFVNIIAAEAPLKKPCNIITWRFTGNSGLLGVRATFEEVTSCARVRSPSRFRARG